jgi:di/tricarboxylate transporter
MTWEGWFALILVGLVLLALAREVAQPDLIFCAAATIIMTAGLFSPAHRLPTPRDVASLFGNEGLLTVGVLYVVAAGLTETGGLSLLTERLLGRPKSEAGALTRMMLPVTGISSVLNNTPAVAMFIPVVHDWCKRARLSPSKLFIPLSYAAILGGCCTLVGTSTNLVVQGLMIDARKKDPTQAVFTFWTLTPVGLTVAGVGFLFFLTIGRRLLPDRGAVLTESSDPRQYTVEMMVEPKSPIDGKTVEEAGLRALPGAYLIEIDRADGGDTVAAPEPDRRLFGGDRLVFAGVVDTVKDLQRIRGLVVATDQVFKLNDPKAKRCLVEAVVGGGNPIVGQTIRAGRFRTRYGAAVIAVHRDGKHLPGKIGDIKLQIGDTLLLETSPRFIQTWRDSRDFLLVSGVEDSAPRQYDKAWIALLILGFMVLMMTAESFGDMASAAFGWTWIPSISVLHAAMIAAGAMILFRCCTGEQARRSVDWSTLVAIGASFSLGRALEVSGAAAIQANNALGSVGWMGPVGILAAVYLLTLLFTEIVTNNAAAALAFPIAMAAAKGINADAMPFAVAIALAASGGFAVPSGYQTHMMVNGPGGYRFSDWLRVGLPMDAIVMVVAVVVTPLIFPFYPGR